MSLVDDFLNGGNDEVDTTFGTVQMVCDGQTFPVVINDDRESYEGALGGLESDLRMIAVAQPGNVTGAKTMLQKRCTVAGIEYRVGEVSDGVVAVTFALTSVSDSN